VSSSCESHVLGVGIVGAGPVTQAIHLPTLARLADRFRVANVMDVSEEIATTVARAAGARPSTSIEQLLADPEVDVVVICSPPQFHADQVIAAMESGKRGVLCEKPLATTPDEAQRIADASSRTGVPFIVGAMHVFDPGWVEAVRELGGLAESAHTIRSRILIPFNDRFEDWASEILARPVQGAGGAEPADPVAEAQAFLRNVVLGLTVHDLPLVRTFVPDVGTFRVDSARLLAPFGYVIEARTASRDIQLVASVHAQFDTAWELEVVADDARLTLDFTPSFVNAGSSTATFEYADGTRRVLGPYRDSGYEAEWRALHELVHGEASAAPDPQSFIADLEFTLAVADEATAALAEEYK
jgi:myo-inositol 2-dehydrogenase / D-chiro-inositol 1-dehydrogenase